MSAIEPRVWSAKEFKKASTPKSITKRHRGTELQLIDNTLERLDKLKSIGASLRQKELVVPQLITSCKNWMTRKAHKTSAHATTRKQAVITLGEQAFEFLKWCKFHERKARGAFVELRGMRDGYAVERTMYVAGGKRQNPVSGSYMHAVMESRPHETFEGRNFSSLTPADFRILDVAYSGLVNDSGPMADPGSMAKTKLPRQVLFLNKQERIKRLVMIQDGLLYENFDKILNTGRTFVLAYVIDEYGNLYCSSEVFPNDKSFNHSTFNAGKDVICAGTLAAVQGKLKRFTNNSGHYKPTRENLHNAVRFMEEAGADISEMMVWISLPDPARPGKMVQHEFQTPARFLANVNAAPDAVVPEP